MQRNLLHSAQWIVLQNFLTKVFQIANVNLTAGGLQNTLFLQRFETNHGSLAAEGKHVGQFLLCHKDGGGICGTVVGLFAELRSIIVAFAGVLIALIGAGGVDSLYRCPKCKKKLLVDGDRETLAGKCSRYCPHCGSEVNIVKGE